MTLRIFNATCAGLPRSIPLLGSLLFVIFVFTFNELSLRREHESAFAPIRLAGGWWFHFFGAAPAGDLPPSSFVSWNDPGRAISYVISRMNHVI
jgi:hypothetical protein